MPHDLPSFENVAVERDGGTTFIILNRPDKRNAMSPQLHMDMCDALDWAEMDDQTKVVVITGAGGNFCAGQDLKLYFRGTDSDPQARVRARRAAHPWRWDRLSSFPKATIAMVHGYCFGGGFTPVIACDFAVAADDATFGLSEVNWGIIPGGNAVRIESVRGALSSDSPAGRARPGSNPGITRCSILRPISFSMSCSSGRSSALTREIASPLAPARPVRPIRCT